MYFSDNNVQYRVSKYDLSTGQYTELWTYTGDDRVMYLEKIQEK